MEIRTKIDMVVLTAKNFHEELLPYAEIPGFKAVKKLPDKVPDDNDGSNYKAKYLYKNGSTMMAVYFMRKTKWVSPLYIIFWSDYHHEISLSAVKAVENFLRDKCGYEMRVSKVDVATDLIFTDYDAFPKVIRTFKPGRKRKPTKEYESSVYFGTRKSPVSLIVYDKTKQLAEEKGVYIDKNVVRVEVRLNIPKCKNFIQTVDDLAEHNWLWLCDKHFSFHLKKPSFREKLLDMGVEPSQPIWKLRDIMSGVGKWPSNFYRDCLYNHPKELFVRSALASYRWN